MPWTPLPRIAFAIATHPFNPTTRDDLPLELGDELYIIESCANSQWYRGYLVAPPSLLAGLTSTKGSTLEARVFSGIFPAACVQVKEYLSTEIPLAPEDAMGEDRLSDPDDYDDEDEEDDDEDGDCMDLVIRRKPRNNPPASRTHSSQKTRDIDRERPPAPVPMLKVGDESSYESEPLVDEIASCLREWHASSLHELLLTRQYALLDDISELVTRLDLARQQLLNDVLTRRELERTREEAVWSLVRGNKLLSREIIVRDPTSGRVLTGEDPSVEITKLQSVMALLEEPPRAQKLEDANKKCHLLLENRAFVGATTEPVTLVFYLATRGNKAVSEGFTVELNAGGALEGVTAKMQAMFVDLGARDTEDLFLIARVYTNVVLTTGGGAPTVETGKSNGDVPTGGTVKQRSANGPPSVGQKEGGNSRLKGRVSVLFSPRPKTSGKEDEKEKRNGTPKYDERPPSATASSPPVPTVPHLTQKKVIIKKALGVGVLDVGRFVKQEQGTEQIMHIFSPSREKTGTKGQTAAPPIDWDAVVKDVIDARLRKVPVPDHMLSNGQKDSKSVDMRLASEKSTAIDRLHLYLRPFAAEDSEDLIASMPTILHQVVPTRKIGFTGAPSKPRSDIYITLDSAVLPRHALLLHPKLGSYALPPTSQFSHLQISLEVRRPNGERIKDCIFAASNRPGTTMYKSSVAARDETWSQTVRLSLRDDDVPKAHVFLTLSGVPNAPAAMSWFPLWDMGAFLKDGDHEILLHKYDEHTVTPLGNGSQPDSGYINMPWFPSDEGWAGALCMGGAAAGLRIKTYLCSTKFSQDDVLLSLLRWHGLPQDDLVEVLKKVVFVPEMEIVKLLREVFDALFQVVVEHAQNSEIEDLVFYALITVLGIVYDRRFNMGPIVDKYAERHFNYPFATGCLLRSFTRLLNDPAHTENSVRLRAAFKVGNHIFRFIVHAREKQVIKEATIGINGSQAFTRDLHSVFKLLETLMRSSEPRLVGSQTLAVQHFHTWLPELEGVLGREDILLIAIDFMDSCSDVKGKLILYKLVLIVNYSRSMLFSQPEDRRALTVNTVRWLEPHWGKTSAVTPQYRDQVRLCCSVLAEQVDELGEEVSEYIPKIIDSYRAIQLSSERRSKDSFSFLFPKTYPFPASKQLSKPVVFEEPLAELSGILAAMSSLPSSLHLAMAEDELALFLMDALKVHMSILSCEAFPENWLSVHIYQHKSTMRTLETLAGILVDGFLPDPDDAEKFITELWQVFFETLLMLVGSDALALETFPEQKRRAVWKVAGDVREQGADLLRRTWESIGWETSPEDKRKFALEKMGGYQVQYVPGLVAPIVELCLSVHEGLRRVAVEVLQTMIVSEWTLNEDLSVVQAEMIDSLDRLFKSKRLTESITQKLFIADLIELFKPLSLTPEDPLSSAVGNLLRTMDEFLDLLVAVHNTPLGEAYQIMDTLRLMDFLKDMRKEDMFIRYVHQLVHVQLQSNNLIEAALSLKLHADLYTWDVHEKVPALEDPAFPEQTAFERREQLFLEMITYFEDGKCWENALEIYRELGEHYENTVFEYGKLARCHRAMANLQESILNSKRTVPMFYRVAYYGLGFPAGLRDRQFIVQAGPREGTQTFSDRMLMQHPSAKIIDGQIDSVEGQFLHIFPVTPQIDYAHPAFRKPRVASNIREYLVHRQARAFSPQNNHPPSDPGVWTEKNVFLTEAPFPAILKRSEIIQSVIVSVSPVERAISAILARTAEIAELEKHFTDLSSPTHGDIGPFSIAITNAVDANKSIAVYRELLEDQATKLEIREALKIAMSDHVATIKKALSTHGRVVPDGLRGVHVNCKRCFDATFRPELTAAEGSIPSLPTSPGQWRANHNHTFSSLRQNSSPPPPPQPRPSVDEDQGSIAEATRGRLTSMIFGTTTPKPPLPPIPPAPTEENTPMVSRASSVKSGSTSRSGKSRGRDRPTTPGTAEKKVGSVRRRWSQLKLGTKREKGFGGGGTLREMEEVKGY